MIVQRLQEPKSIAAAYEERFCFGEGSRDVRRLVHRSQAVSHISESIPRLPRISVGVVEGERNKENFFDPSQKITDFRFRVIEIAAAVVCRIAYQQNSFGVSAVHYSFASFEISHLTLTLSRATS